MHCLGGQKGAWKPGQAAEHASASMLSESAPHAPCPLALRSCLESFLAQTKQDNITVHDAFVDLLQSCGW